MVGNHSQSVKAQGSLTARPTSRAGTKVGLSDPVVPHGRAIAQRIKATPGITGLSPPRVHIDGEVWRSEEHTSELQSRGHLVCRLLLEKKNKTINENIPKHQR